MILDMQCTELSLFDNSWLEKCLGADRVCFNSSAFWK